MNQFTSISTESIEGILSFLTFFKNNSEELYTYNGEHTLEPYSYHPKVSEFMSALYEANFIQAFEWKEWHEQAKEFMENPAAIQQVDWDTLIQLITYHIRKERFESGYLKEVLDNRQFLHILERIEELNQQ